MMMVRGDDLAAAAAARGARGDGSSLELLEMLEHADHRVARRRVRLVGDRATEADAQLGAELGLDQAVRAQCFLGIIVTEVRLASSRRNPHGGECGRTPPWL